MWDAAALILVPSQVCSCAVGSDQWMGSLLTLHVCFGPCCVPVDGDVFMWGINKFSQCGGRPCEYIMSPQKLRMPATDGQRPVDITGGKHHSIMLTEDGQVYAWGAGAGGRLGFRCPLYGVTRGCVRVFVIPHTCWCVRFVAVASCECIVAEGKCGLRSASTRFAEVSSRRSRLATFITLR